MARSFWCAQTKLWVPEEEWRVPLGPSVGPMIMKDVPEHRSPIDGEVMTSRSHRREHMRRHKVVEMGDAPAKPRPVKEMPPVAETLKQAAEKFGL